MEEFLKNLEPMQLLKNLEPMQFVYGAVAVLGGIARYLNSFATGTPFSLRLFLASTFVSGFSGWMFAIVGISLALPSSMLYIMAGTGGFFGDQTMKFIMEYLKRKTG